MSVTKQFKRRMRRPLRTLRRGYGITIRDLIQAVQELEIEKDCDQDEAAELMMLYILDSKPKLVEAGLDWEALLELFLKILPLILALFGL